MKLLPFILLAIMTVSFAGLDQQYMENVNWDGSITITRSQDIGILSSQLPIGSFSRISQACSDTATLGCSMEENSSMLNLTVELPANTIYSTVNVQQDFPYTIYILTINKIPTDIFATQLSTVLSAAGFSQNSTAPQPALDLSANNTQTAEFLEQLGTNTTYVVDMPGEITNANNGNDNGVVTGNVAQFDLIQVLNQSGPITVQSRELNGGAIVVLIGAVVLIGFAASFFSKKQEKAASKTKANKMK